MVKIASIVEGDGEVTALPVLLRKVNSWLTPEKHPTLLTPIRVHRDRFLNKPQEFSRHLLLAAAKCESDGWILILLDADDYCPMEWGEKILSQAKAIAPHRKVSVVLAKREYEAWFIASAESLDGHRNFTFDKSKQLKDPESRRDAKGWMKSQMANNGYHEVTDQPAFTSKMDLELVEKRSRSFRKLCKEWVQNT